MARACRRTWRTAISVPATRASAARAIRRTRARIVFDNDHPSVGPAAPAGARAAPPGSIATVPRRASRAWSATARGTTSRSPNWSSTEVDRAAGGVAGPVPGSRRARRHRPRARLREQGRGGRRLQSAPALPDLRDEFRVQDNRDRSARRRATPARDRPRAVPGHSRGRACRRPPHHRRERHARSPSCRTSPATPTRCSWRRRRRTRASRRCRTRERRGLGARAPGRARAVRQPLADAVSRTSCRCTRRRPTARAYPGFHFHVEFHPPLRKPNLLKYLAGPEIGGGNFLSDTAPEEKAAELRAVPAVHYRRAR